MNPCFFASWQHLAIACVAAIAVVLPARGSPPPEPEIAQRAEEFDLDAIARANNQFAIDLYHQLNDDSNGNLLFSPYSLSLALGMTYSGARGETARQMAQVMYFPWSDDRLHVGLSQLQERISTSSDPQTQISTANRVWLQQNYRFLASFLEITRSYYGAEPELLDFAREPEACRSRINEWVSQQTQGKIDELIPNGAIDELTRFVLTNAIYFKSPWFDPFDPEDTQPEVFTISPNQTAMVPTMIGNIAVDYAAIDDLHVVKLWYTDDWLSMVILLPEEGHTLADIEATLTIDNLERWLSTSFMPQEMNLWIPKFKIEADFDLSDVLDTMGMSHAFGPRADFSGASVATQLQLGKVLHSTFIDVNEEGTEAAGATAVVGATRGNSADLHVDRPFIFLIWDEETESILFLGRLVDPR